MSQGFAKNPAAGGASVTSAEFSVLSARVAANSVQMTSADNALSVAISAISTALSAETANRISVDNVLSNAVSIVSAAQAVTSAQLTSAMQSIDNFGDVSVSGVTDGQVLMWRSVSAQWIASTPGGGASVTSAEYTSLINRVSGNSAQMTSADDAISNAVSIVSAAQALTSAAVTSVNQGVSALSANVALISTNVSAISTRLSALSTTVATNSADFTSFKQSINNFDDVSVSEATDGQVLMWRAASAQWVASTPSGGASVTSAEYTSLVDRVSGNSAQMTSADNAISNAVSIVSAAQAVTSAAVTSVNQIVSVLSTNVATISANVSAISTRLSALSTTVATNSADFTSFKASLNNIGDVSVDGALPTQVLMLNVGGQWVASTVIAGGASVTSAEYLSLVNRVSGNSAQMTSADDAISNAISIVSAAQAVTSAAVTSVNQVVSALSVNVATISTNVSAISTRLSALSTTVTGNSADFTSFKQSIDNFGDVSATGAASGQVLMFTSGIWQSRSVPTTVGSVTSAEFVALQSVVSAGGGAWRTVASDNGISATTLTNVSGLSLTFSAGGLYKVEGMLLNRMSVANAYRLGATWPAIVSGNAGGFWQGGLSTGNNTSVRLGMFNDTGSGSVTFSVAAAAGVMPIILNALFLASAGGTFQVQAAASVTTSPLIIKAGSYIRAYKLN